MKNSYAIAITASLALILVLGFAVHAPRADANASANGAFRDGVYQAKLDAQFGRKTSIRTGRWRSDADRTAFLNGYQQGSESAIKVSSLPTGPELLGFRDGVAEGSEARRSEQPLALRGRVLRVAQVHSVDGGEPDPRYLQAYVNGYQYGYYTNQETLESEMTGNKMGQF